MQAKPEIQRALRLLGLAARAGRVIAGIELLCTALKRGTAGKTPLLILEAGDSSENSHKRINDRAAYYGVPIYRLPIDGEALGLAVGKREKRISAIGVTEPNLAKALEEALGE